MRTVKELRSAGYCIDVVKDAAYRTEISCSKQFWYFPAVFCLDAKAVHDALREAKVGKDGRYVAVINGTWTSPDESFPLAIVSKEKYDLIQKRWSDYCLHRVMAKNEAESLMDIAQTC